MKGAAERLSTSAGSETEGRSYRGSIRPEERCGNKDAFLEDLRNKKALPCGILRIVNNVIRM